MIFKEIHNLSFENYIWSQKPSQSVLLSGPVT